MIIFFRSITALALAIALLWLYLEPKFDSAFAFSIALAAVIGLFIPSIHKTKIPNQSQQIKDDSFGIQAGGNVSIENLKNHNNKNNVK